ncbi:MAG: hypothetical protein A3G23_09640 [Bacteroidetes bacterium RIFCSPLOWO2_12_FULL_37_12]|nr:MAG: hypothetical protein A3G23_09640 [Bacteroidetes bacterium RIFCSPLOWO2_12_FULL_37_12]
MPTPALSIVATVYNDANLVSPLVEKIREHVEPLQIPFEIILSNDGSTDDSEKIIEEQCHKYSFVRAVSLSRNFGQQIAASAGLRYAKGEYIVLMDGDLQNPPEAIPTLYKKIKEGYDIVYTRSKVRNNFFAEWFSALFWFIVSTILHVKIIRHQLMLRMMNSRFVSYFNSYNELTRAVAGITQDIGMNYTVIDVENKKRPSGKSKSTLKKRLNLMTDLIFNLTYQPLNIMIYFGLLILMITLLISCYYLFLYFFIGDVTPGYTSIILTLFFFGSMIITILGIIGRYLANIYLEVKNRPLYLVQRTFNMGEHS